MFRPVSTPGPAGSSNPIQSNPIRPPSPLTGRKLVGMPGFSLTKKSHADSPGSELRTIRVGGLGFIHCSVATQAEKIDLINQVAGRINALPSDRPITIVSLGSAELLVEDLIFKQLSAEHQKQVRFRLIDPDYAKGRPNYQTYKTPTKIFGRDKEAEKYVTSTTYLASAINGKHIADSDHKAGPVIILSVNPPSSWGLDPEEKKGKLELGGVPYSPSSIGKANAIYIKVVKKKEHVNASAQVIDDIGKNYLHGFHNRAMICFADKKGGFHFEISPNPCAQLAFGTVQAAILSQINTSINDHDSPLQGLYKAVMGVLSQIEISDGDGALGVSIVSGYDRSEGELKEYFASSKYPAIFASLKDNKIELNDLN
jgi:hypothetical protein